MKFLKALLIACLVFACSDNGTTETKQSESSKPTTMLKTQIDALDKAKGVEESLQKMTNEREEKMRQQGI